MGQELESIGQAGLERNVESWKTGARAVVNQLGERLKANLAISNC